jgi:hypothetical protein
MPNASQPLDIKFENQERQRNYWERGRPRPQMSAQRE